MLKNVSTLLVPARRIPDLVEVDAPPVVHVKLGKKEWRLFGEKMYPIPLARPPSCPGPPGPGRTGAAGGLGQGFIQEPRVKPVDAARPDRRLARWPGRILGSALGSAQDGYGALTFLRTGFKGNRASNCSKRL